MEARGAVNQYRPYKATGQPVNTVNLANGVTPFMAFFGGKECASNCYRLANPQLLSITHAWYRPTVEEFKTLDRDHQEHVLNGGLLCAELHKARTLPDDPVEPSWEYEQFQEWCLRTYGRRRPPMKEYQP
jgi:hypothetical protein